MTAIFISHKESDALIARRCVDMILESLRVKTEDVFCSSVAGHQLKFGSTIESQIKEGVSEQQVLFAILTKDSIRSTWVLFELGAAWAIGKLVVPILGPGVAYADLPGALGLYPCISCDESTARVRPRIADAFKQSGELLGIRIKSGAKQVASVDSFLESLTNWKTAIADTSESKIDLMPTGYELYKSGQNSSVFKSKSEPSHCLCPTCYGKDKKIVILQGDLESSKFLFCRSCKSQYWLKPDAPIAYSAPRASTFSTRGW